MAMLRYPLAQVAAASCLLVFLSPLTAAYGVKTGADDTEVETWLESLIKLYQPTSDDVGQQQQTHYFTQDQIDYFKNVLNKMKAGIVKNDLKQEIVDHFFPKDSEEKTTQEEPQTTTPADSEEQVTQDSEEQVTQEQQTTTPADDSEEQVIQEQQTKPSVDDSQEQTTQQEQQTTSPAESEEQSKQNSEEDTTQQEQQTTTPADDSEENTTQQEQYITPVDNSEEQTTQQEQQTTTPADDSEEQTTQQEQQATTPADDSEEQTTQQEQQATTPADDSEEQTTQQEQQTTTPADDSEEQTTQQEQQATTPADVSEEDTTQQEQQTTTPADSEEQSKEDSEDTDDDDDSHEKTTVPVIATTTVTPIESTTTVQPVQPSLVPVIATTTVTPIESTTTVQPVQPSLELCNNCVVHHGVGYAQYPGYCDAYIQCRFYGALPTSVDIRRCPAGNFWNQDKLTCDFEANVKCTPVNGCPNHKAIPGDWAAYLINNGQNWTRVSCPEGRLYNSVTCGCTDKHGGDDKSQENCYDKKAILDDKTGYMQFTGNGWVRMACPATVGYNELTCRCTDKLTTETSSTCPNTKPIPGDRSGYMQFTGVSWISRPCPATLVYSPELCICTYDKTNAVDNDDGNSKRALCKSTLILNFDNNDATDSSTNKFWVNNTGVTFNDGKAYFNGKSRLTIPGLSNVELGFTVYISIKYRHSSANSKQTLVANGDCQVRQSLAVCSGKDSVDFYAETKDQISLGKVTVPSDVGVWQNAVYALDNGNLVGTVGTNTIVQPVKGALDRRQRGLVIGGGGDCDNFHGIIDEVQVFLCKPEL